MTKSKSMTAGPPVLIDSDNLGVGWAKLLLHVTENPGTEIAPLVFSLHGFDENNQPVEDSAFRGAVDKLLAAKEVTSVENVAFTIFPQRYWVIAGRDRKKMFDLYKNSFRRLQAMNKKLNRRGLYFERMMMFDGAPCDGNQLEWGLSQYESRSNVRRSMLQACVFDPARDHVADAQLGFPCLQNVSYEPTTAGLVVNAFYATQQLFDKSYGNYLGLSHLGGFLAQEMKMPLARLNVFVGVAKLERITKSDPDLAGVIDLAKVLVETAEPAQ